RPGQTPDQTPGPVLARWLVGSIDPPHWEYQVVAGHHQVLGSSPDVPATADTPPHPAVHGWHPNVQTTSPVIHPLLGHRHQARPCCARRVSTRPPELPARTPGPTARRVGP